jgi:Domain of unknown function (DUF4234)
MSNDSPDINIPTETLVPDYEPATSVPAADAPVITTTPTVGHPGAAPAYAAHGQVAGRAPIGRIRGTGACIALTIVTLGIYSIVWFYKTHEEMKNHSGAGIGGGLAAVLAFFVGIVMPFLTSSEIGNLYRRAGMAPPVSGATGLWYFPGAFIVIGPLVWFVKTNAAINSYWRSLGAV